MGLQEKISADLLVAMKAKDAVRMSTLRLVKSAVGVAEILRGPAKAQEARAAMGTPLDQEDEGHGSAGPNES